MRSLHARVRRGRLVLDEATDLPEGQRFELVPVEDDDDLNAAQRADRDAAVRRGLADHRAGRTVSGAEVLRALKRSRAK